MRRLPRTTPPEVKPIAKPEVKIRKKLQVKKRSLEVPVSVPSQPQIPFIPSHEGCYTVENSLKMKGMSMLVPSIAYQTFHMYLASVIGLQKAVLLARYLAFMSSADAVVLAVEKDARHFFFPYFLKEEYYKLEAELIEDGLMNVDDCSEEEAAKIMQYFNSEHMAHDYVPGPVVPLTKISTESAILKLMYGEDYVSPEPESEDDDYPEFDVNDHTYDPERCAVCESRDECLEYKEQTEAQSLNK